MITDVTDKTFEQEVKNSTLPVMVDFWAPWCGPCKQLIPLLKQYDTEYGDKVKFVKVNVDDEQELSSSFNITSIPTVMFFKNGQLVETIHGFRPGDFKKRLDNL
jgi:thioredoxin 1